MKFRFSDSGRVWEPRYGIALNPMVNAAGIIRQRVPWPVWVTTLALFLVFLHGSATAQGVPLTNANPGMFDNIAEAYLNKAKGWESGLQSIANGLFGGLAVISIAWTFIKLLLQKDDLKHFIPTITLQILTLGFFLYLVNEGTAIATMIISSFEAAASKVGGTGSLSPSETVTNGFDCMFRIMEKIGDMDAMDSISVGLPLMLCGVVLCLAFVGVAILFLVTLIESYFVLYGGVILLGFGALPWTREIPKNYLIYAINVGVKLFVINLVVGIGVEFSSDWPGLVKASDIDHVMHVTLYLMSGAMVFLAVAWKVPGIASALTSGALNFNASDAMGTTAAAAGVGAAAGAAATGGISALASATKGAVQATTSGVSLAREQGASGVGAALKGLGLAGNAIASEAGSAAKASAGLQPPSAHAVDGRGRNVENLGTRAANSLQEKAQQEREASAARPQAGDQANATAATDAAQAEAATQAGQGGSTSQQQGGGSSPSTNSKPAAAQSVVSGGPKGAEFPAGKGGAAGAKAGSSFYTPEAADLGGSGFKDAAADSAKTALKPPTLPPPDQASGSVSINLNTSDD